MTTKAIRYRGHVLVVHRPGRRGECWGVLVWPPSKEPPMIMPTHESEETAIQDAQNAVDRLVGGMSG